MSTANPPFYTGPDLSLPDADDFLHNPSTATTPASQAVGDRSELATTDSKGTFLLDWNLHYDDHEATVQENLPDSSLFSDLMVDFGNTGGDMSTQSFPSDQILELNSPGIEIFSSNEMLSPKRNKILPPFSGPAQLKTSKLSNTATTGKKETKANSVLNCICNQPQTNRFILVCDKCDKWFHCECVGISQDQGEEMSRERHIWLCPVCNESTTNKTQAPKHVEPKSHIATRSQNKLEPKVPILKIPKRSLPVKEGKRCYLKSCQKRLTNQSHHFCSNNCIEVTVSNLKSFYQIKGLPSADSERVTLLDKSNMKVITGVSAPTLGGLASWLKSHSTQVPIKPQPRPSQDISVPIKLEVKLESPISDHEEIVRGKARKQLSDILLSRVESSPENMKYSESIPQVASQIEVALYALDRSISTRYKNRYRSLSFSLRDPKNIGLYRRVVSGEALPENLVQMSTEQLAPESSNSSKDAKNNSNTDISTTHSKTLDKQQSSGSSGEMARKNVHNQPKSQDSSKYLFDEKNKQIIYGSKQLKPKTSKSNDIPPLMTTEIDLLPPKFSPTLSDSDEHSEMDKIVWRGSISMPNLAKCATNGCLAYGPYIPEMEKILPQNVQVHGRIIYSMVWDYLKKIISSTTKGLVVLRLIPRSREEETSFTTLFNYFHKRQRCGVAGGCTATVRDLYLLPFTKGDVIPTILTSLQGPGVPSLKTDTLLAMIVTNKITESSPNTAAMKRNVSDTDATITAELRANDQKSNLSKQDISSLTNPSAPLPFASIQSKSELPFSSSTYPESANVPSNEITSKLFNPSDLYKPISESESSDSRKDTYMIPYDKAKSESPFKFNLGPGNTGDHIFPGLGEILKKSMDDPIIEDALSNLHFKKPIKDGQITSDTTQKFHTEYGLQYQGQYGYNNPSNYTGYPSTEKPVEVGQSDIQAMRSQPQTNTHPYYSHDSQVQNTDQYNRSQNVSYYGQEHIQHSIEHQLQQGHHVSAHAYPPHENQVYPHNTTDYWQQESIDAQHKQKQHEMLPNQQYQSDGYSHQQWPATSHNQSAKNPQQRPYEQEYPRYSHNQNEQYPQHEDYTRLQKHDTYPPSQTPQDHTSPEHRLPLHLDDNTNYPEHRQMEQYRRPAHEYSQQNEHVGEYGDHRMQREQYQGDRYFDRGYLDKEQQLRHDESEKSRDLYPHQYNVTEAERDWKPPYGHLRDEDKWTGNDRRGLDRNLAGGGYKQEREEDIWELERARRDYRLTDAELVDRPLPTYLHRRLPLRTVLSHLDLARRDLESFRGRGSHIGIGVRPSLLERDRPRIKRDFAPDTDMLGVPLKLYRTLESPPKPSFEPISRTRPTLRVRKRDRMRKSPKLKPRDESKDDESIGSRKERRSRRRSRFSRSRDVPKKEDVNNNSQQQDRSADMTQSENTREKPLETKPDISTDEMYPQVVQEMDNNNETARKNTTPQDTGLPTSNVPSQAEDEKLSKFPPKHLQREKLLAMQEKLHSSTPSKVIERSGREKHRSRSRSRERDGKSGRRKRSRSRSREWGRRTHSRDDLHREKEPASIIRERLMREREAQPSLRERQLLVLEREREIMRARARLIPAPGAIDGIRERSPLRMGDIDPRRPLVTPFIRSRALDELRRERIERGVPGGVFRGQYLYQGPRQ